MSLRVWFVGAALATCALGSSPFLQAVKYHEARSTVPAGFKLVGRAAPDQTVKLNMALSQNDADGLIAALYDVSDPASANYGKHLSKSEVEQLVAPKSTAVDAVNAWLSSNNITGSPASPTGDWVSFEVPVDKANELFSTDLTTYTDLQSRTDVVRSLAYALPAELQGHVDFIHPLVSFANGAPKTTAVVAKRAAPDLVRRDIPAACNNGTTPACLQYLYNIPTTPAVNKDNQLAVTGRHGGIARRDWLQTFLETLRPDIDPTTAFTDVSIDGGVNDQNASSISEGDLDIQYTVGMATGVPIVYTFLGDFNTSDGVFDAWLDQANYFLSQEDPPRVLTSSWGALFETQYTQPVTERLCQAYAQMGARGITYLVASLDEGVGCNPANQSNFVATFPSNCPYLTSVGGTDNYEPETAWFASTGGFADYFPAPDYQKAAVENYIAKYGAKNAGRFNASGRGFPDISALAVGYPIFEGEWFTVGGTSAASPVIASMVALVNDRLRSAGKPSLGFLNPLLYSEKGMAAITDIVLGNSSVTCEGDDAARGFDAAPGWDPVTGVGSIKFDKLLALAGL